MNKEKGMNMINWNEINIVLLDMDGTLLDDHYERMFWDNMLPDMFAEKHKINIEDSKKELQKIYNKHIGTNKWGDIDFWEKELDMELWNIRYQISHLLKLHPHTINFLEFLKKQNKKVFMVTAAPMNDIDFKFKHTKLEKYFIKIYTEIDIGYSKHDIKFWEALKKLTTFDNDSTLLAEDNEGILKIAKIFGIKHLILKGKYNSKFPAKSSKEFLTVNHFDEIID